MYRILAILIASALGCGVSFQGGEAGGGHDEASTMTGQGTAPGGAPPTGGTLVGGAGGASHQGGASLGGGEAGGAGPCIEGQEHLASVADCIAVTDPDPDACAGVLDPGVFVVDTDKATLGGVATHGFLRFDVGVLSEGVSALQLVLTVGDASDAGSVSSGEVWRVTSFIRADLFNTAPTNVDTQPVGTDQGNIAQAATVTWVLPSESVAPDGSLYLAIRPLVGDGVQYHSVSGGSPPRILVSCARD